MIVFVALSSQMLVSGDVARAAPILDASGFSIDHTLIDFEDLTAGDAVTTQYSGDGVLFDSDVFAINLSPVITWPGSADPVLWNFNGTSVEDYVLKFDSPVVRAGFDAFTGHNHVELTALLGGTVVETYDFTLFATAPHPKIDPFFIGLDIPGGFDELVIHGHHPFVHCAPSPGCDPGSAPGEYDVDTVVFIDDLRVEFAPPANNKNDILQISGIENNGVANAPGLDKEFNPKSQAADRAGKKK
jgi:hypothetical protein